MSTFLVELHLVDVLEVLLVVDSEIYQMKIEDKYQRKKDNMILHFILIFEKIEVTGPKKALF